MCVIQKRVIIEKNSRASPSAIRLRRRSGDVEADAVDLKTDWMIKQINVKENATDDKRKKWMKS